MVADFEKNAAAYDAICDSWAETRNKSPINRCVVQFAALLEKGVFGGIYGENYTL